MGQETPQRPRSRGKRIALNVAVVALIFVGVGSLSPAAAGLMVIIGVSFELGGRFGRKVWTAEGHRQGYAEGHEAGQQAAIGYLA